MDNEAFIARFRNRLLAEVEQADNLEDNFDATSAEHHRRFHLASCLGKKQIEELCDNTGTFARLLNAPQWRAQNRKNSTRRKMSEVANGDDPSPCVACPPPANLVGQHLLPTILPITSDSSHLLLELLHHRRKDSSSRGTGELLLAELQQSVSEGGGRVSLRLWLGAVSRIRQHLKLPTTVSPNAAPTQQVVLDTWQVDAELAFNEVLSSIQAQSSEGLGANVGGQQQAFNSFSLSQFRHFLTAISKTLEGTPYRTQHEAVSLTEPCSSGHSEGDDNSVEWKVGVLKGVCAPGTTPESSSTTVDATGRGGITAAQRRQLKHAGVLEELDDLQPQGKTTFYRFGLVDPVLQVYHVKSTKKKNGEWMPSETAQCVVEEPVSTAVVDWFQAKGH